MNRRNNSLGSHCAWLEREIATLPAAESVGAYKSQTNFRTGTPNALAMRRRVSMVTAFSPRSISPMNTRERSARSASFSWERAARFRWARIVLPSKRRYFGAGAGLTNQNKSRNPPYELPTIVVILSLLCLCETTTVVGVENESDGAE